jgi:23S rRNA (cytosine1962-C5)-methyltransferase
LSDKPSLDWASLPVASAERIALRIHPAAERAVRSGHPWLYAQAIRRQSHQGQPGDLAVLFDRKDRFLAVGLYDPTSPIRVRILQREQPATIDQAWFLAQIKNAALRRQSLPQTQTSGYRLVHGENDGMPGLVIDRYHQTYVLKLYTPAWIPHLAQVVGALITAADTQRIVLRLSRRLIRQNDNCYGLSDGDHLYGNLLTGPIQFQENGLLFEVDVVKGQKTGFFLDQRENRARVERLAAGRSVLNVFAYTGGFSLYAARGGAIEVSSLDISQPALAAAGRNFALNQDHPQVAACRHILIAGDAFDNLARLHNELSRFDLVIIDPPSFAKQQSELQRALAAYARLTSLGIAVLAPGGTLVMASCSRPVEAATFFEVVRRQAADLGRALQFIEQTYHPLDHPVGFREGAYLKCLFARVP